MLNLNGSIDMYLAIAGVVLSSTGSYFILRLDWKRYGFLFLLTGIIGNILCYLFVVLDFYTFPYTLIPNYFRLPFEAILTIFPFYILLGVRYSPISWSYKIPFYWVIVHLGLVQETLAKNLTQGIKYGIDWDFWDSYTAWWIFFLLFEWIGGKIIPDNLRNPIKIEAFRYGNWAWILLHFILILTFFLGGLQLGLHLNH